MATTLTGLRVQDTYNAIIKIGDNSTLTGTGKLLSDGFGNSSNLYLSTTSLGIGVAPTENLHIAGSMRLTGSFKDKNNESGTTGQVLTSTATGTDWKTISDIDGVTSATGGTANYVPVFTSARNIENSIIQASATLVTISGNLDVNGTVTYIDTIDLSVKDPLIKLANANVSNTLDIGFYGKYVVSATTKYLGLYSDASDSNKFRLFTGLETEPTTVVDSSDTTFAVGTLIANIEGGTISGTTGTFTGDLIVDTDTLFVDVSADKIGINNSNPNAPLTVGANASSNASTGLEVNAGTDGANLISLGTTNHNWFPYTNGYNYYSAIQHIFRSETHSGTWLNITSSNATFGVNINGTTATFTGLVTGIAPTADLNFATKKYVDDSIPVISTPALSAVLAVGNTSGSNNLIIQDDDELILGSSNDFRAYHNQTNTLFRINTGDLIFNSFVDDGDIKFQLDDGSDPAGLTEYMRLDGGATRVIFGKSIQVVDNVNIFLGNSTTNTDGYIKWDSTASQIFIGGDSKFLNDLYCVGDVYLTDGTNSSVLQFATDAKTRKIVLYEGADNDYQFYGFGIESSTLVYSTYDAGDDHVFFVGVNSTSRSELMRIKSTGDVVVANDVFSDGLYINSTTAVAGTQVAIVGTGSENLQRWGSSADGSTQASYRFRIDQDYKFISNSGSGDNLTIFSDTGNLTTTGQITAVQSTFTRGSSGYTIRLDSSASTVDNDLRFAKGGTDYGAIQTAANTTHNFEFFVNDGTNWLSALYFDRTYGTTEVTKALRVGGDSAIPTGVGLELRYVSALNESRVISYDRGNSAYKGLRLIGSTIDFETSGNVFSKFNHTFSYISNADSGNFAYPNLGGRLLTSNGTNWDSDGRDPILTLSSSGNSDSTEIANSIGLNLYSNSNDDDTFSPAIAFSGLSNSTSYASAYGLIIGKKTGQANDSNWNAGELQFYTGKVGAYMSNVPDLRIDSAGNAYFAASITVAGGTVFNSNLTVQGNLTVDGTTLLKSNTKITNTGDVEYLTLNTTTTTSKRVRLQFTQNDNAGIELGSDYSNNGGTNFYFYDRVAGSLMAYFATDKSYLPTNSKLGIGTDSPTRGLTIAKSNEYASLEIIKGNTGNQIVYLGTGSSGAGENPILQLKEGTVEKVRLYASGNSWINGGNLGVGIDNPTSRLTVFGSQAAIDFQRGTGDSKWEFSSDAAKLYISEMSTGTRNYVMAMAETTGDVAIGTTSTDAKFKVEARDASNNIYAGFRVGYAGGSNNYYDANTHNIRSGSSSVQYATIGTTGASFNKSITIGTTGTYAAGSIYSDSNWGMILRAKQASPVVADFMFANSADVERLRITSTAATFAGEVNLVRGINMTAGASTLYATDGALSYYSATNGVYLNGAGVGGWLRLNASGLTNNQFAINIYGGNAGGFIDFRTSNLTRLTIDSDGDFQASVNLDKNYEFGKAHIGYMGFADHAGFSHIDSNNPGTYALLQDSGGTTYVNAAPGKKVNIRQNNNDYQTFYQTNFGLNNTSPQFWIHSGTTVAIPNSRYLNFVGTGATEITQANFRQSFVCSYNDSTATSQPKNIGIILHNESTQDNNFTPMLAFGAQSNSGGYSQVVAGIAGKRLGTAGDSNWSAGELWFWTGRSDTIGGANQGLPAANPAMIMTSTRQIGIATTSPASGVKLDVQAQALIGSIAFNDNRINSGYSSAANNLDMWINYEGYLNGNSYYRDFRVGNGRNGQIMHWDGDTSKVAIGQNASSATARFQVLHNGDNGSGGDSNYGILARATAAGNQATIGAIHSTTGHANLNLGNNDGGLKFWHISKRLSGDAHRLEFYYNAGSFISLFKFETSGTFIASADIVAYSDKRLKENIKTIDNALLKVSKLRGVSYNRTDVDDKSTKIGVIAQEINEVLPEVVNYNEKDDKYGVDYGKMAGVFIEAIKELKAEVDSLKQEIKQLKK